MDVLSNIVLEIIFKKDKNLYLCIVAADYCLNHGYEPQSKLWKQFRSKLRGIVPSAVGGIIQHADITALRL
jgi:hypothetical protein